MENDLSGLISSMQILGIDPHDLQAKGPAEIWGTTI